jgi:hypothetical protein
MPDVARIARHQIIRHPRLRLATRPPTAPRHSRKRKSCCSKLNTKPKLPQKFPPENAFYPNEFNNFRPFSRQNASREALAFLLVGRKRRSRLPPPFLKTPSPSNEPRKFNTKSKPSQKFSVDNFFKPNQFNNLHRFSRQNASREALEFHPSSNFKTDSS